MKHSVIVWGLVVCTVAEAQKFTIPTLKGRAPVTVGTRTENSSGGYRSDGYAGNQNLGGPGGPSYYEPRLNYQTPANNYPAPVTPYGRFSGYSTPVHNYAPYSFQPQVLGVPNVGFPSYPQGDFSSLYLQPSAQNLFASQIDFNSLLPTLGNSGYPSSSGLALRQVTKLGPVTFGVGHGGSADASN